MSFVKVHRNFSVSIVRPQRVTEWDLEATRRVLVKQILAQRIRTAQVRLSPAASGSLPWP